ncbi:hypothetical protein PAEVO_16430 [Paenibacillus sp. GM2FR]|uniref:DedA family protein n=1 Tax=Paenibacillus TaxID=44249 RepID=UPI000CABA0F8|nr:DedA family protein [Paenibacillus lautus]PJN54922.1 hypothetical protein PAEVO_16430 [Paenibacillus sp. GM2FR]
MMEMIELWFKQYGYLVLLIGLPLDFIALPIPPGNTTLTYTGYLSFKNVLDVVPAFFMALAGAIGGITITYCIGYKLGAPLIERYGGLLLLKPSSIQKVRHYYNKYGDRLLLIGFFIPGIRQFIGYFIGVIRVPFRNVILYAYTGACLWVIVFFSIGYLFGDQWNSVFDLVENYIKIIFIGVGCIFGGYLILIWLKRRKMSQHKNRFGGGEQ